MSSRTSRAAIGTCARERLIGEPRRLLEGGNCGRVLTSLQWFLNGHLGESYCECSPAVVAGTSWQQWVLYKVIMSIPSSSACERVVVTGMRAVVAKEGRGGIFVC